MDTDNPFKIEKCIVCSKNAVGDIIYACTVCDGGWVCSSCYSAKKETKAHQRPHYLVQFSVNEMGLPYAVKHPGHEHPLLVSCGSPFNPAERWTCANCKVIKPSDESANTCAQCKYWLCERCKFAGGAFNGKLGVDFMEVIYGKRNKLDEAVAATNNIADIIAALKNHYHFLTRYPASPYATSYQCDICGGGFSGVVYHCDGCGNFDVCPACYTPELIVEQKETRNNRKTNLLNILNNLVSAEATVSKAKVDTKAVGKNDEVHKMATCASCATRNWVGVRYDCLVCKVEMCGTCVDNKAELIKFTKHTCAHPMERIRAQGMSNTPLTLPHNVPCDGCDSPSIFGTRHQCLNCPKYNLCEQCFKRKIVTKSHDLYHKMQILLGPGETRQMIDIKCNSCGVAKHYGTMIKCLVCVGYHLCYECFIGGLSTGSHSPLHSCEYVVANHYKTTNRKKKVEHVSKLPSLIGDDSLPVMLDKCKAEVANIIANCKKTKTKYTDPNFKTDDTCLFRDPADPPEDWIKPTQYLRITEICNNPVLFNDGITPDDVDQGAIGTCYLLGDLSGLARYPHLILELFVAYDVEVGVYAIRFFMNNKWDYVIVDDYIPCNANKRPIYGCCTDRNETWVMLIEKAYAKLHMCYENINGGLERIAFSDLTGGVAQRAYLPDGFRVNADGTTGAPYDKDAPIVVVDDSLSGKVQAAFSSATVGTWRGTMRDVTTEPHSISELELLLSFSGGEIKGGGKDNFDQQFTIVGSTDKNLQYVWFLVEVIKFLPTKNIQSPFFFIGYYNPDSPSIQGNWLNLDFTKRGNFRIMEVIDADENIDNRLGPFSSIWDILTIKQSEHVLMSASIDDASAAIEEKTNDGLLKNHAYSLIDFYKLERDLLIVKLRNPHGKAGWKGKWAKGSKEWTPERKAKVGYVEEENGEFYIDFETFMSLYNSIDMCRLFTDDWQLQTRESLFTPTLCGGAKDWMENPQFKITPSYRGKFVINVSQPTVKIYSGEDTYPIAIGFKLVYYPFPTDRVRESTGALVLCNVEPTEAKSVSTEIELDALQHPYFLIPYTNTPAKHLPIQIGVYSTCEFDIVDLSYLEDPVYHPIHCGRWTGVLVPLATERQVSIDIDCYFDAPSEKIYGCSADGDGKYFILGKFKEKPDTNFDIEFQMIYFAMREGKNQNPVSFWTGTYFKKEQNITGFVIIEGTNCSFRLTPVIVSTPPSGYYKGMLTLPEFSGELTLDDVIFHNNRIYGSFPDDKSLAWFSLFGSVDNERNLTICQTEHGSTELMYFGKLSDDGKSFTGKLRGVFQNYMLDGEFTLTHVPEKLSTLPALTNAAEADDATHWYYNIRPFQILEYFRSYDIPEADIEVLVKEIVEVSKQNRAGNAYEHQKKKKGEVNIGRTEIAKLGRKELPRFGRKDIPRYGRNEMNRYGRSEMVRFGRNEMMRFGRQEMHRFGRNEMKRFGRKEAARFGRGEMRRFGRKLRDDKEEPKKSAARLAPIPLPVAQSGEMGLDTARNKVKELSIQLHQEKAKVVAANKATADAVAQQQKIQQSKQNQPQQQQQPQQQPVVQQSSGPSAEEVQKLQDKVADLERQLRAEQARQPVGNERSSGACVIL